MFKKDVNTRYRENGKMNSPAANHLEDADNISLSFLVLSELHLCRVVNVPQAGILDPRKKRGAIFKAY